MRTNQLILTAALVALPALAAASGGVDCPHRWQEVRGVEIKRILDLPHDRIQELCGEGVEGCITTDFQILVDATVGPNKRARIIDHEKCHAYEVQALGRSWQETAAHTRW